MSLLPLSVGDDVLHIHSYSKKSNITKIKSLSTWKTELESNVRVEDGDVIVRLDDPALANAKIDYERYLCIKTLGKINIEDFSQETLDKIDELNELLIKEGIKNRQETLFSIGYLTPENAYLSDKLK